MTTHEERRFDTPSELVERRPLPGRLPVLALKDTVVFPFNIAPLFVTREASIAAVQEASSRDRMVFMVAQRQAEVEDPHESDLYALGTVGVVMRMFRLPDERIRILVQGLVRARMRSCEKRNGFLLAEVETVDEPLERGSSHKLEALVRSVKRKLRAAAHMKASLSPEVLVVVENLTDPGKLADMLASHLDVSLPESQSVLETVDPFGRLARIHGILAREVELAKVQMRIDLQAREEIDRSQREHFLRQQIKVIQTELGELDDSMEEVAQYRRKVKELNLPLEAREEATRQIKRLERLQSDSAEAAIVRGHLDWFMALPWSESTKDNLDLRKAKRILDREHSGLEHVKTRILEYLAVLKLKRSLPGPILCLVGPPGVGKTSLGKTVANALGRRFVRISLGGVHDEAEIRGHRRTYVGAMPGRIIQALRQAGSKNPVVMLDEADKMGADPRGDPAAALLEVLDPEQNSAFRDNFLGVCFDLSLVLFIATANVLDTVRPAFRDRLEVIRLSGYTGQEKLRIARRHLLPKQMALHGIRPEQLRITDTGIKAIIEGYTEEAGVRSLEREVASVCRKVARQVAEGTVESQRIGRHEIPNYLGAARKIPSRLLRRDTVGVATALAWTPAGGDIFFIEVVIVKGKGNLILTGQLGEVMKESAQAALSYARDRATSLGIEPSFFEHSDVHIHAPEGAIPKDGPSAGVALAVALISACTRGAVRHDIALTGEITLRGRILPVGGIREKVLAAQRSRIQTVILPAANADDVREIPGPFKEKIDFHFVHDMDEVVRLAVHRRRSGRQKGRRLRSADCGRPASPLRMKPKDQG